MVGYVRAQLRIPAILRWATGQLRILTCEHVKNTSKESYNNTYLILLTKRMLAQR